MDLIIANVNEEGETYRAVPVDAYTLQGTLQEAVALLVQYPNDTIVIAVAGTDAATSLMFTTA